MNIGAATGGKKTVGMPFALCTFLRQAETYTNASDFRMLTSSCMASVSVDFLPKLELAPCMEKLLARARNLVQQPRTSLCYWRYFNNNVLHGLQKETLFLGEGERFLPELLA